MKQWLFEKRSRMILAGMAVMALPVMAIALYVYFEVAAHIENMVLSENRQTVESIANHMEDAINKDIIAGKLLTSRSTLQQAIGVQDSREMTLHLRNFVENVISIERALITDVRGVVIADYPAVPEAVGQNLSDRDWYKGVSAKWESYISEFHLRRTEPRRYIFAIAIPIKTETDRPVGILVLHPEENYIADELGHITNIAGQKIYIADNKGNLIYHSDYEIDRRIDLSAETPVRRALNGESGAVKVKNARGGAMLAFYHPVKAFGWGVVIQRPEKEVFAPLRRITGGFIVFSALMLFIGIGAATMLSNLTFSLKKLSDELEERVSEQTDELQANKADLAEAQRVAKLGSWRYDIATNAVTWSDELLRIYEMETATFGGTYESSLEFVHDQDRRLVLEAKKRALESGESFEIEYRIVTRTGTPKSIHEIGYAMKDSAGRVVGLFGVAQDVTERRLTDKALQQSEAFVKNILESVDEGFIVVDRDYRVISANTAYCKQLKTTSCDIIGRHCYEVSHRLDRPCFHSGEECAPAETFRTGAPHVAIHTHFDKEGKPVYLETKSFPMRDDEGNIHAAIETLNNITDKRILEEQLRHTQKMEAIGTLAGGIAHDFNNMLNVIMGYGGLMQMKMKPDDPLMENLREMLSAGERAAQLTKGLLTFSRKQVMEVRTVNINEIVDSFRKMLTRIIGEDIELRISLNPSQGGSTGELIVKADIVQIEQVLMNLAANARDAMPKGGILSIETQLFQIDREFIKAHGYGEPGDYAIISISDSGEGMDELTRERIFEPFFTTKELGRGTGLGLSIVYGIVKQHKGYINCYSEIGKGTTFRIYLPLVEKMAGQAETAEQAVPEGGDETILIAEDDVSVRGFLKQVLEGFGYRIIEAVDGEDAVRRFRDHRDDIQLLLFDLIMPRKNGKDAYEEIKTLRGDIKTVFISGYTRDIVHSFDIEEGFDFIMKPVSPNELLCKVREILDRKQTKGKQ